MKCSICKEKIEGFGNNAQPINDGICCDDCNLFMKRPDLLTERTESWTNKVWDITDVKEIKELNDYWVALPSNDDDWDFGFMKQVRQNRKLIEFIETGIKVQYHNRGLILLEDKFVVSLNKNRWKILGKNKWYHHSYDINNFVNKYIKNKGDVK